MAGFTVAGMAVALSMGDLRAAAGFGVGAGVALLGYSWLHKAVVAMMNASDGKPSSLLLGQILIRFPLVAVTVFVFYREDWLPYEAVLAGLFIPVAAAVAESLYQISSAFLHAKAL